MSKRMRLGAIASLLSAAVIVVGCGGGGETTTTTAASTPAATGPSGATGASGEAGAGGDVSIEDARDALESEGFKVQDVDASNNFVDPDPDAIISIEGPGGVAQGTIYGYSDPADAEKAAKASEEDDSDDSLDNVAVDALFFQADTDPSEGPTVDEMIEIVGG